MTSYNLTNKAVEDLSSIWEYTFENWSELQADRYYNLLLQSCQDIAENPNLGKNYEGIRNDLYGLISNKHVIFYRKLVNEPIEITRILHERMDLKRRITE